MTNYQCGIQNADYNNFKPSNLGYNLREYRQEYTGNTSSENFYNNLMKFIPKAGHIGNYKTEK